MDKLLPQPAMAGRCPVPVMLLAAHGMPPTCAQDAPESIPPPYTSIWLAHLQIQRCPWAMGHARCPRGAAVLVCDLGACLPACRYP
jgi:hypothetical protein